MCDRYMTNPYAALRRKPFHYLAQVHLTAVAVLPGLLQMESGGVQRSGGVLGRGGTWVGTVNLLVTTLRYFTALLQSSKHRLMTGSVAHM
jgi:hypothetical protein